MHKILRVWSLVALAACFSSAVVDAAVLGTYGDRTSWEAVVSAGTRVDVPFASPMAFNTASTGLSVSGASFVGFYNEGTSGYFTYRDNMAGSGFSSYNLSSFGWVMIGGGSSSTTNFTGGLSMAPPTGMRAVGFNFGAYADNQLGSTVQSSSSTQYLIRVFEGAGNMTGEYTVSGVNRPNLAFFGVATSGDISGVQLFTRNIGSTGFKTYALVDNFSFGGTTLTSGGGGGGGGEPSGGEVPEPGTYLMAGLGLVGLVLLRRRR